jgi:outer membrane immunogenic protein
LRAPVENPRLHKGGSYEGGVCCGCLGGYAFNNWLVYATGGLAVGGLEHSMTQRRVTVAAANRILSEDDVRAGWTVGGGVEVAVAPHWSVGAEYLYMDFGNSTLSFPVQVLGGVTFPASTHVFADTSQVVRAKVDYRF